MQARDFAPLPERITFTVDLEDHAPRLPGEPRYLAMTRRILDFLAARRVLATFFVVGDVAERSPELVREVARAGHEIASHSHRHRPLGSVEPRRLGRDLDAARKRLEDLAGAAVLGFRAPLFSLVPASGWAIDVLAEAGFRYSSSIIPARSFGAGWAEAPATPFRWPNGLLELPCPVGRVGWFPLPFLGGMYLRYLPPWRLRQASRTRSTDLVWTYCHPYDFDTDEPFRRREGAGTVASFFLWWNRRLTLHRLATILEGRRTATFRELFDELLVSAPTFIPGPRTAPRRAWRCRA